MAVNTWQVKCINKIPREDPYHAITHIGFATSTGTYKATLGEAIDGIETRGWKLYVHVGGKPVYLQVGLSPRGNKYLKTEADGREPNNLLRLPECV